MSQERLLNPPCPVCGEASVIFDVVDFNKCCEELRGTFLPMSGTPIYYCLCSTCGFLFAPEFATWTQEDFRARIYNSRYADVDPDYKEARPRTNAKNLLRMFGNRPPPVRHLDYGGGSGVLSGLLLRKGWSSISYDPFVDESTGTMSGDRFGLITAFEVFEHAAQPQTLMAEIMSLLNADGVVLFSTLTSDGHISTKSRLTWWYASPRNGHISIFSRRSLSILGARHGFQFGSFSPGFHAFWKHAPAWAKHLLQIKRSR